MVTTQAGSPQTQLPDAESADEDPLCPTMSPLPHPVTARDILCPDDVTRPWEPWLAVADSTQAGFIYLFVFYYLFYFWLRWVFTAVCGLSLVAASGGYSSLWCAGFSLQWLLLLRSTGFRSAGFSSVARGLSSCGAQA